MIATPPVGLMRQSQAPTLPSSVRDALVRFHVRPAAVVHTIEGECRGPGSLEGPLKPLAGGRLLFPSDCLQMSVVRRLY